MKGFSLSNLNINNLTIENLPDWPLKVKIGAILGVCLLLVVLAYWIDTSNQLSMLQSLQSQEVVLKQNIELKQQEAANLNAYKIQLRYLNEEFTFMINQLPSQTEVPKLLEYISQIGAENGLEFKLFKPLPEIQKDFFAELPIQISVIGNYHQLAHFVSDIAALPRIVTLHDFTIGPLSSASSSPTLTTSNPDINSEELQMDIMAKTYRYTANPPPSK